MPQPVAQPRHSIVNCRVAAGEREQIQRLAESQGLTQSELIRRALESQGFRPLR